MPFSDEYFRLFENVPVFHDRVVQKYSLDSDRERISERLFRCIWYDRLYDETGLRTNDGKPVVVHSPGTWNLESGPDFRRAELTIGGRRLKGDIELHLDSPSWRSHGHSNDPRYDNVVLHVILFPRSRASGQQPPVTRHGTEIPEVVLWDLLTDDLKLLKSALRTDEYPYGSAKNMGKCQRFFEQAPPEVPLHLLSIAGDARILAKQRRFGYEAERHELDQVVYAAVFEGMGYKAHTKQFAQLARKLPYPRLRGLATPIEGGGEDEDKALVTQALLFASAGLLQPLDVSAPPESRDYVNELERVRSERGLSSVDTAGIEWKKKTVRPANLPERRVAGVSHVVAGSYEQGLWPTILSLLFAPNEKEARTGCVRFFTDTHDEFWSYRYSVAGKRLEKPVGLIGRDRALTIVVNAFIPLGLLHARTEENMEKEEKTHRLFRSLPSLSPNNVTRLMEYKLFGNSPKQRVARNARTQQGLLQLFSDWCSEDPSCENCGLLAGLQQGDLGDKILRAIR